MQEIDNLTCYSDQVIENEALVKVLEDLDIQIQNKDNVLDKAKEEAKDQKLVLEDRVHSVSS